MHRTWRRTHVDILSEELLRLLEIESATGLTFLRHSAMTKIGPVTSRLGHPTRQTLSGAHVGPLSSDAALLLIRRLGLPAPDRPSLALGAYDDGDLAIGVLATEPLTASSTSLWVAVTPECRRLRVATDLWDTLLVDHAGAIRPRLVFRHAANSPLAANFIESIGLKTRRLAPDQTLVTLTPCKGASH
jgi:hypothetical protein